MIVEETQQVYGTVRSPPAPDVLTRPVSGQRMVGEDKFSSFLLDQVTWQTLQDGGRLLVCPEKDANRSSPKRTQRCRCLEDAGSIRKFGAVPQVPAGRVQNVKGNIQVEVQTRRLMVFAVGDHNISWVIVTLNGSG